MEAGTGNSMAKSAHGAVSVEQALAMFDHIVDRLDLQFQLIREGCQHRAHLMCNYFLGQNVIPQKAWLFEDHAYARRLEGNVFGKRFSWGFHVAPVIRVVCGDKALPMVVDPALFDGPVDVRTWALAAGAQPERQLQVVDYGVAPEGCAGDYSPLVRTSAFSALHAQRGLQDLFLEAQQEAPRKVYPSALRMSFNRQAIHADKGAPVQGYSLLKKQ